MLCIRIARASHVMCPRCNYAKRLHTGRGGFSYQRFQPRRTDMLKPFIRFVAALAFGLAAASAAAQVQSAPPFAIDPGITGAWYDPSQSGHGLFIEVLSD